MKKFTKKFKDSWSAVLKFRKKIWITSFSTNNEINMAKAINQTNQQLKTLPMMKD